MPRGGRLLELGCGTGTEALEVSRALGARVLAFDPSPGMLARARVKGGHARAEVEFRQGSAAGALRALQGEGGRFDGAWASFSLCYEASLAALRPLLRPVLSPGAPFVCTLRNSLCLVEPWSVFTRASGVYRHRVGERRLRIRHESARSAARALSPDFRLESTEALPVLLPSPGERRVWPFRAALPALQRIDARVAGTWPLRHLGDHLLLRFRRAGGGRSP
jgi:SAM-dependent methyltransferase